MKLLQTLFAGLLEVLFDWLHLWWGRAVRALDQRSVEPIRVSNVRDEWKRSKG